MRPFAQLTSGTKESLSALVDGTADRNQTTTESRRRGAGGKKYPLEDSLARPSQGIVYSFVELGLREAANAAIRRYYLVFATWLVPREYRSVVASE